MWWCAGFFGELSELGGRGRRVGTGEATAVWVYQKSCSAKLSVVKKNCLRKVNYRIGKLKLKLTLLVSYFLKQANLQIQGKPKVEIQNLWARNNQGDNSFLLETRTFSGTQFCHVAFKWVKGNIKWMKIRKHLRLQHHSCRELKVTNFLSHFCCLHQSVEAALCKTFKTAMRTSVHNALQLSMKQILSTC